MGAQRLQWWSRHLAPPWSVWKIAGIVLAVLLGIAGLVVLGFYVVAFVGLSQLGSNK